MKNPTANEEMPREMLMMVPASSFESALELFTGRLGFRIDMIFPADSPSVAVISGHGTVIRLEKSEPHAPLLSEEGWPRFADGVVDGLTADVQTRSEEKLSAVITHVQPPATAGDSDKNSGGSDRPSANRRYPIISRAGDGAKWVTGRAGMEYRDLIPGRLDGWIVASHIRIIEGGEVPDYVHYHNIRFQMIYCVHGRIRVVYEDCGEPFWLMPGDCVLQPPEIRHRVLVATAGAQVIEIGSPAIHETWADHDLSLPTSLILPDRDFGGQRFVHHIAADSPPFVGEVGDFESHHTEISSATGGMADVFELRSQHNHSNAACTSGQRSFLFYYVLSGRLTVSSERFGSHKFAAGDSIVVPPAVEYELNSPANSEILCVFI